MARHLELDVQDFSERFLTEGSFKLGDESSKLLLKRGRDGKSCIFLDEHNKCKVHPARPVHVSGMYHERVNEHQCSFQSTLLCWSKWSVEYCEIHKC